MEKLTKKRLKLLASSSSLENMISLINSNLCWNVLNTTISNVYQYQKHDVFTLYNSKGEIYNTVVINEKGRYKLYNIL